MTAPVLISTWHGTAQQNVVLLERCGGANVLKPSMMAIFDNRGDSEGDEE